MPAAQIRTPWSSCQSSHGVTRTSMTSVALAGPVNGTGTQLSVAWNATARTATIVFKGSTTREDWITVRPGLWLILLCLT